MMHMVLELKVKLVLEQEKSKVFKMILMFILQLLQNQWQDTGAFIAADQEIIDYLKYNLTFSNVC